MEDLIIISNLNDFIFCPASIYFHKLYGSQDNLLYQSSAQINGTKAHETIDEKTYSTRKSAMMSLDVYSEKYGLCGKIDLYESDKKRLIQLYAQYYAMTEMGYEVKELCIRSMDDNKNYKIALPEKDLDMQQKFEQLIAEMRTFNLETFYQTNIEKCKNCIYEDACDRSLNRGE